MTLVSDIEKDSLVRESSFNGFRFGAFEVVGQGDVTNEFCGKFSAFWGCVRSELHNKTSFNEKGIAVNHAGKAFIVRVFNSCDKPSCPICYRYGWAVREAHRIETRLLEASKLFGLVEHIVVSVPSEFYGLDFKALHAKAVKALKERGVLGGVMMFHGTRRNKLKQHYWSPHWHVLGYVLGGYGCRGCKKNTLDCLSCDGFEGRTRRCYEKDKCIVKVLGKRITVIGTAWYQLNHASRKVAGGHVATWFGVCSYRKLKVTSELKKRVCPICQHDLEKLMYSGFKLYLQACYGSSKVAGAKSWSFEDVEENGQNVWMVAPVGRGW